jgi:glutamyl-tRNA reductase
MHVVLLGLSHAATPVEIRERATFSARALPATLSRLAATPGLHEAVLLSTCNRTELYAIADSVADGHAALARFLQAETELPAEAIAVHGELLSDADAVTHLFRVAAGLESLILGEGQILGQVKDAHATALEHGTAGVVLDRLFRAAVTAGKRARTETDIARGAVSVSSAAVELARDTLGGLSGKSILLLGAGKMSELAARQLGGYDLGRVMVANRSFESAQQLAAAVGGEAIAWIDLAPSLAQVDVVLCSTGAPHHVLTASDLAPVMRDRAERPLVLIDISVPRNLDPALREVPGVTLCDIDDLQAVATRNRAERAGVVDAVAAILAAEIDEFQSWVQTFQLTPMITSLRSRVEAMRELEWHRFTGKHQTEFTPEQLRLVEEMTRSLVNKILHQPTAELKRMTPPQQRRHASALKALFGLKVEDLSEHYRRKIDARRARLSANP